MWESEKKVTRLMMYRSTLEIGEKLLKEKQQRDLKKANAIKEKNTMEMLTGGGTKEVLQNDPLFENLKAKLEIQFQKDEMKISLKRFYGEPQQEQLLVEITLKFESFKNIVSGNYSTLTPELKRQKTTRLFGGYFLHTPDIKYLFDIEDKNSGSITHAFKTGYQTHMKNCLKN